MNSHVRILYSLRLASWRASLLLLARLLSIGTRKGSPTLRGERLYVLQRREETLMKQALNLTKEEIDLLRASADKGISPVEEILGEWMTLTEKPLRRGGDVAVFEAVVFKSKMKEEVTSAVLLLCSKEIGNSSPILVAFTLGVWLGQSQEATLTKQVEDLDG